MMKDKLIILAIAVLAITTGTAHAQIYRTAATDALENNGKEWIEKKLPPSLITFSDYSGEVSLKTPIASLFEANPDLLYPLSTADTLATFTMTLDREQVQQQITSGKMFSSSGTLVINNTSKKTVVQCLLLPRNNPEEGFSISIVLRFNPTDFGMRVAGEPENSPLIVKITSDYLNKSQNNF